MNLTSTILLVVAILFFLIGFGLFSKSQGEKECSDNIDYTTNQLIGSICLVIGIMLFSFYIYNLFIPKPQSADTLVDTSSQSSPYIDTTTNMQTSTSTVANTDISIPSPPSLPVN